MGDNKRIEILRTLEMILIALVISIVVFKGFTKDKIIVTQTQTVTINTEDEVKININTATKEELKQLPGIGDKTSDLIIKNRPYTSIYELLKIDGIGDKTLKSIERRITIE